MAEEKQDINKETDTINWKVPEYQGEQKTKLWYAVAGLVAIILLAYAIFTGNPIFAIIIIFAAILVIALNGKNPNTLEIVISDQGIRVGKEFYDYAQIDNFFIIYKPEEGIKNLYLEFKRFARPTLPESEPVRYEWLLWLLNLARTRFTVPLLDMNPVVIRRNLLKYIKENLDRTEIPLSEQLTKLFRL